MAKKIIRVKGYRADTQKIIGETKRALIHRDIHLSTGKIPSVIYEFLNEVIEELGGKAHIVRITKDSDGDIYMLSDNMLKGSRIWLTEDDMNPKPIQIDENADVINETESKNIEEVIVAVEGRNVPPGE